MRQWARSPSFDIWYGSSRTSYRQSEQHPSFVVGEPRYVDHRKEKIWTAIQIPKYYFVVTMQIEWNIYIQILWVFICETWPSIPVVSEIVLTFAKSTVSYSLLCSFEETSHQNYVLCYGTLRNVVSVKRKCWIDHSLSYFLITYGQFYNLMISYLSENCTPSKFFLQWLTYLHHSHRFKFIWSYNYHISI